MTTNLRRRLALRLYPGADRMLETSRRQVEEARAGRDRALRGLDDLAVRILSACLAVGRIGLVDVDARLVGTDGELGYRSQDVDLVLDTARAALLETEDVARYATQARRIAHTALGHRDPGLALTTARGTLERLRDLLTQALDSPSLDGLRDSLEHAETFVTDALEEIERHDLPL